MKIEKEYTSLKEFIKDCKKARGKFIIQYYQRRDTPEFEKATVDFLDVFNRLLSYTEFS